MRIFKIILFGIIAFAIRFAVGGALYMGAKINPQGFWYGVILSFVAFLATLIFLRFVIKPKSLREALGIAVLWTIFAIILDIASAGPILHVPIRYLFSEIQVWTRLIAIIIAAFFAVRKPTLPV
jgi:hypothetical protein